MGSLSCDSFTGDPGFSNLELYKEFAEEAYSVALHPSGLYILVGFSDKLRLMNLLIDDIRTFKEFTVRGCKEVKSVVHWVCDTHKSLGRCINGLAETIDLSRVWRLSSVACPWSFMAWACITEKSTFHSRFLTPPSCPQCAFSSGGHLFAAVHGNIIAIYSTMTFDNVANLKGHNGKVRAVIWSQDDSKIVSCGQCVL